MAHRAEPGLEWLHDAEYLAIARLQADALVTIDEQLALQAAQLVPLVPLAPFEELFRPPGG